jgi:hypothetical protein
MEKLNHICTWKIEILSGPPDFPMEEYYKEYTIRVRGICPVCKRIITTEELERRANVGEREYARQASYVKRDD